jgi:hypothetical protein
MLITFCALDKPKSGPRGGEPLFSVCGVSPKTDKEAQEKFNAAIRAACELGKPLWGGKVPQQLDLPLRDGDLKGAKYPEFKGSWYFNAKSKFKPGLVDADGNEILDPSEIYSGCTARLSLNLYPYSALGNVGIGIGLNNVMKISDGKRLTGRGNPADDFTEDDEEALLS